MPDRQLENCRAKQAFETRMRARKSVLKQYRHSAKFDLTCPVLAIYRCSVCGKWHKTSRIGGSNSEAIGIELELTVPGQFSPDVLGAKVTPSPEGLDSKRRMRARIRNQARELSDLKALTPQMRSRIRELEAATRGGQQLDRLRRFVDVVRNAVPPEVLAQIWDTVDGE